MPLPTAMPMAGKVTAIWKVMPRENTAPDKIPHDVNSSLCSEQQSSVREYLAFSLLQKHLYFHFNYIRCNLLRRRYEQDEPGTYDVRNQER
jgi:hypothetical protein